MLSSYPVRLERRTVWVLASIFMLALVLRLAAIWAMSAPPDRDALQYHSIAVNLLTGHGYAIHPDIPTSLRPPVYPVFLAAIYGITGVDYHAVLLVQALLNAAMVFPVFFLGWKLAQSMPVALIGALLFALHTSFEIVTRLYAENILIPLSIAFVMLMPQIWCAGGHWYAVAAGLVAGVMGLTKPEFAFLGVATLLLGWFWIPLHSGRRLLWLVMGVSLLLTGVWQWRNMEVQDAGQVEIEHVTLLRAYYPAFSGTWWWPATDMRALEQMRDEGWEFLASHPDSDALREELLGLVMAHPFMAAKLMLSRELILWASPPVGSSMLADISAVLKWAALLAQYAFVLLAFATLALCLRDRRELFSFLVLAAYMTVVYGLVHAIRRYGYAFVPELCMLAAWGAWLLWCRLWGGRRGNS